MKIMVVYYTQFIIYYKYFLFLQDEIRYYHLAKTVRDENELLVFSYALRHRQD